MIAPCSSPECSAEQTVVFGRTRILCQVRYNRRKDIAITVTPDMRVTVSAPVGTVPTVVEDAVRRRAAWIIRQLDWLCRHRPPRPRLFVSGESFFYLGRQYQLRVLRSSQENGSVGLKGGRLEVAISDTVSTSVQAAAVRSLLVEWYQRHAPPHITEIADALAPKLGVRFESIRLMDMPTRWGSGGNNGRLRFNWRVILAPRRLVEYVVAHELTHIRHCHHSPDFWRALATVLPDCRQRRNELDLKGASFSL